MIDSTKDFGNNVTKCRKAKNMTQEQLAELSGLHRTYISSIERGVRNPTVITIIALSKAMDVNPSVFFASSNTISSRITNE